MTEGPLIQLKRNHAYYSQIQGQMGVIGNQSCYFLVFTHHGYHLENIEFDKEFWSDMIFHLKWFWEKYIGPELLFKKYVTAEDETQGKKMTNIFTNKRMKCMKN